MDNTYIPTANVLRKAARIVHSETGGPIRYIITGRKSIPTGRWHSAKTDRSQPWEGRAERDHLYLCEADTDIAHFLTQPHRLEINVGAREPLVYLPDCAITRADGSIEIVEIKRAGQRLKKEYVEKIDLAREIYEGLGWRFVLVVDAEIRREPRFYNARRVCARQPAIVTTQQTLDAIAYVGGRDAAPARDVARLLGDGPGGWARLHALIIERRLHIDLETPKRRWADAPVTLVARSLDERRPLR